LFAGRDIDIARMLSHLKQVAQELELPFGERQMTFNSRRAQELGKWAEEKGRGEKFHRSVFEAYFAKGLNIFEIDVLESIVRKIGLEPAAVQGIIQSQAFKAAVDSDWKRATASGITAVPTFVAGGQTLVGAQPYHVIKKFLQQPSSIL
jgi:predicted DsbA family dithiol-disulfide isomerase